MRRGTGSHTISAVIIGGQFGPRLQGKVTTYHGKSHRVFIPRDWCCHDWIAVRNTFF